MAQQNIKQIKGTTQGSILFLGTYGVVSENFNSLNWNESNNSLNIQGSFYLSGSASIGENLIVSQNLISGTNTVASNFSLAAGQSSSATGLASVALGFDTQALATYSFVSGIGTIALSEGQFTVGKYNENSNDGDIFVIGNGSDNLNRSDLAKFGTNSIVFNSGLQLQYLDFTTQSVTEQERRVYWNENIKTLEVGIGQNSTLSVGQEELYFVLNQTGATLSAGKVVKIDGASSSTETLSVNYFLSNGNVGSNYVLGVVKNEIPNNQEGFVTKFGLLRGIDTTGVEYGETWSSGDILYASSTVNGGLSNIKPSSPNLSIQTAIVISATSSGAIFVNQNYYGRLSDLDDVNFYGITPSQGNLIRYSSTASAWLLNEYNEGAYNAGVISGATGWSDPSTGQIVLPSVTVALYDNANFLGPLRLYNVLGATTGTGGIPLLTNNDTNYIFINYNSGNPIWDVSISDSLINDSSVVRFMTVYRNDTFIHTLEFGNIGSGLSEKLNARTIAVQRCARESGLTIGLSGSSGILTISEGVLWNGPYRQSLASVDSVNDYMFKNWRVSNNWTYSISTPFTYSAVTDLINNTYYDNGDLITASAGYYLANYYYRGQEVNDHIYEIYSQDQYETFAEAELAGVPIIPELVSSHAILVGRVIVQVGTYSGVAQSSFVEVFESTTVTSHNDLIGLQGGITGEYFHLSSTQYTNNAYTNVDNQFSINQTINGYQLKTETWTESNILIATTNSVIGSGFIFNDSATTSNNLWSAQKIFEYTNRESIAGQGLSSNSGVLSVNLGLNSGLTFSGDDIIIDSTIAGLGLTFSNGVLNVNIGLNSGLTFSGDDIIIDSTVAGLGLTFSNGELKINLGEGLTFSGDDIVVDPTIAGTGLTYSNGVLNVNLGANSGLTFSGDDIVIDSTIAGIGLTFTNGVLDVEFEPDLFTSSSVTYSVSLITGKYNYLIGIDTSVNPVVVELPSASFGRAILYIKDIGGNSFTNNITILPDGTDTILTTVVGATSVTLEADGSAIICSSDGVNTWWLM